ncbi:hypothetical protein CBL_12945 [Carabus blaptoides fortunei]
MASIWEDLTDEKFGSLPKSGTLSDRWHNAVIHEQSWECLNESLCGRPESNHLAVITGVVNIQLLRITTTRQVLSLKRDTNETLGCRHHHYGMTTSPGCRATRGYRRYYAPCRHLISQCKCSPPISGLTTAALDTGLALCITKYNDNVMPSNYQPHIPSFNHTHHYGANLTTLKLPGRVKNER